MNNQNIHSMQGANGRFVPPQQPALVEVHLASRLSAVQRSNSATSAPEPGQDIKDQVLALAGFSKEQMNSNSNTELPHRCTAPEPDPIIALQQTVAGSVAPVAGQAVTTREPIIPEPSFTLLTAPTLRKRRNSMPATLTYDYFLQPLTEDRVGTILNKLGKRLDGEDLRLLYGAIQYYEYGHRDLLQANTDYEIRKQHYEAMKKFRDEGNAKYFKLEEELEDMKRQHEYDEVKMAFFDQTVGFSR